MCRSYNKNRLKPLSPNDFRVSGGGKKTPLIGITNISGMPDYENALLVDESTTGRVRITQNTNGRGEVTESTLNIHHLHIGERPYAPANSHIEFKNIKPIHPSHAREEKTTQNVFPDLGKAWMGSYPSKIILPYPPPGKGWFACRDKF